MQKYTRVGDLMKVGSSYNHFRQEAIQEVNP